jgi:N-acetylglucosamine-6-sulfatase
MNTDPPRTSHITGYNRRAFIKQAAAATLGAPLVMGCTGGRTQSGKKRNVVFILSDDHRYDALSGLNHPIAQTPSMDRLLRNGICYKNAFVTHSLCSPSRASILTGLYSHQHGVIDNKTPLDSRFPTFPSLLQKEGYTTGFIGKWHMGGSNDSPRTGFNRWISFRGQGRWFDNVLNIDGDYHQSKGYVSDVITDFSLDFIRENKDRPFCLFISHKAVHEDFTPAPRHKGRFKDVTVPRPVTFPDTDNNYRDKPHWVRRQRDSLHGVDGLGYTHKLDLDGFNSRYAECLLGLDESIGAVTDLLAKEGLLEETLIIYMGDNGFQFGEHGLIDKRVMYEESIRVPLLIHCPALTGGGRVVDEMILNLDIAPTILEAAGLQVPGSMHGKSFFCSIKNEELPDWRKDFLYQYFWEAAYPMTPTIRGIRTEKYSYIKSYGVWDTHELYDIQSDPYQTTNLLADIPLYRNWGGYERALEKHLKDPELRMLVDGFENRIPQILQQTGGTSKPGWS